MDWSEEDVAYAAGIIDGKGTITLERTSGYRSPSVTVAMNDIDVLRFFQHLTGGDPPRAKRDEAGQRTQWLWRCKNRRAFDLIKAVAPYLRVPHKRARAALIISTYDLVTKKYGNYTPEERQAKEAFEEQFFALQPSASSVLGLIDDPCLG